MSDRMRQIITLMPPSLVNRIEREAKRQGDEMNRSKLIRIMLREGIKRRETKRKRSNGS